MRRAFFVLILMGLPLVALGLSWDATFEATPANTDPLSEGDNRIRELKDEVRNRGEVELCWGTADASGCTAADNGRARLGSARVFVALTEPGGILGTDTTGSQARDNGRCWFDTNGPDDSLGTEDDFTFSCFWNGAFHNIGIGAYDFDELGDVTITTPASGQFLAYDGSDWVNKAGIVTDISTASITTPVALAATTPTAISLGTNPSVVVPAAGRFNIEVFVQGTVCTDTSNRAWGMDLVMDPAGTPSMVASTAGVLYTNYNSDSIYMHHFIENATNGNTYTFGLQGAANSGNDVFVPAAQAKCATVVDTLTAGTPALEVVVKLVPVAGVP